VSWKVAVDHALRLPAGATHTGKHWKLQVCGRAEPTADHRLGDHP